jgi:hypothetical protein
MGVEVQALQRPGFAALIFAIAPNIKLEMTM